jgi:hypothetical protein
LPHYEKGQHMNRFLSQTELGVMYGVSSHRTGKWLVEAGLRETNGKPKQVAFLLGIVQKRPCKNPGTYYYVWDRDEVETRFKQLGFERLEGVNASMKGGD